MPVIREEDVLVKIHAAGVNRADLMQRNGEYPSPEGCPPWMGLEIAGEIADMGKTAKEQSEFHIGDPVCTLLGGGGYAEYAAVRHDMLMPVPRGFSMEQAAAIPETYATAYLNLFLEGNLKKEETVFIHGRRKRGRNCSNPDSKAVWRKGNRIGQKWTKSGGDQGFWCGQNCQFKKGKLERSI